MQKQILAMENGRITYLLSGGEKVTVKVVGGTMFKLPNAKSVVTRIHTSLLHFAPLICGRALSKNIRPREMVQRFGRKWKRYAQPILGGQLLALDLVHSTTYHGWRVLKLSVDTWRSIFLKTQSFLPFGLKDGRGFVILETFQHYQSSPLMHLYSSQAKIGGD